MTRNIRGRASGPVFFDLPMSVHPALLLAAWIAFACVLPWLSPEKLVLCSLLLAPLAWKRELRAQLAFLLRRTRVLLLAMVLLYGFFTPGTPLVTEMSAGPSIEGLRGGALQAWRLMLVLLSLGAVLSLLGQEKLLAGLSGLLTPFKLLGMPVERFAVRLSLTMQLAQMRGAMRLTPAAMALALDDKDPEQLENVELEQPQLNWFDGLFVLMVALVLGGLLW